MGLLGQLGAECCIPDNDEAPGLIVQAGRRPDPGLDNLVER